MLQVVCVPINHHKGQSNPISAAPREPTQKYTHSDPIFFVAKYFCLENGSPWDFLLSKAHPQRLHKPRLTPKLVSRLCCFSSVPDFPPVLLLLPSTCSEAAGAVSSVDAPQLTDSRRAQEWSLLFPFSPNLYFLTLASYFVCEINSTARVQPMPSLTQAGLNLSVRGPANQFSGSGPHQEELSHSCLVIHRHCFHICWQLETPVRQKGITSERIRLCIRQKGTSDRWNKCGEDEDKAKWQQNSLFLPFSKQLREPAVTSLQHPSHCKQWLRLCLK